MKQFVKPLDIGSCISAILLTMKTVIHLNNIQIATTDDLWKTNKSQLTITAATQWVNFPCSRGCREKINPVELTEININSEDLSYQSEAEQVHCREPVVETIKTIGYKINSAVSGETNIHTPPTPSLIHMHPNTPFCCTDSHSPHAVSSPVA